MGFRSILVSQHYSGVLPNWFKNKYDVNFLFPNGLMVVSKKETKFIDNCFFKEYKRAVIESGFWHDSDIEIEFCILSEDGDATKVEITKNEIKYYSPVDFEEVDEVYCK